MNMTNNFAYADDLVLGSTYTAYVLDGTDTDVHSNVRPVPSNGVLQWVNVLLSSMSGTALTQVDWYLSWDSAGDKPLTDVKASKTEDGTLLVDGATGGFAFALDLPFIHPKSLESAGTLYLQMKKDGSAGAVTAQAYLFSSEDR